MLTKEEIEKACQNGHPAKTVDVPEWGGEVCLREPTRAEVERAVNLHNSKKLSALGPRLMEICICDDQGGRMFQDGQLPAVGALAGDRLFNACLEVCGLGNDEELLGKGGTTASGTPPT